MGQFRKNRRRAFAFESLESRRVMAGDVTGGISAGDLWFNGDSLPNAIEVRGNGVPGQAIVTPLVDQATGQQTTFNGSASPSLVTGITRGLSVDMRAGNDEFSIKDLAFPGEGYITGGAGADSIRLGNWVSYGSLGTGDVTFGALLRIDEQFDTAATDKDYIFLGRVTVGNTIDIWGNLGDDYVEFYNVTANASANPNYAIAISGEAGNDVMNLAYVTSRGIMDLEGDNNISGNDLISVITSVVYGDAHFDAWHGTNTVAVNANQFLGKLDIYGFSGNDTITLTNSYCAKYITIVSYGGNDSIRLENNTISEFLAVDAGAGYDGIVIQANSIVGAVVYAGSESDAVTVRSNIFYGRADFYGRAGYDLLYMSGNLFLGPYGVWEFESIQP